jgi:oligosaccharide repeat unit polymerase
MNRPVANPRPARPRAAPPPAQKVSSKKKDTEKVDDADMAPHPSIAGSILCLVGLSATAVLLHGVTPVEIASSGAIGVLLSLLVSMAMDMHLGGIRNLIRTDLMALLALYFLTLAEFLFDQTAYNNMAKLEPTRIATLACICAYAGMIVGRHLVPPTKKNPFQALFQQPMPSPVLFAIFWTCFGIGYLNMLLAVHGNVIEMVEWFMTPRFTQPWQRGTLGDWKAMLYETSMILYLVPPLGGILIGRRRKYPVIQVFLVLLGVIFTLFYGFSSGTRNLFASYLVTFMIGYAFAADRSRKWELIILTVVCAVTEVGSAKIMLEFRDIGLLDYVRDGDYHASARPQGEQTLAVDHNLYAISRMVEYFPRHHAYTNFEIPYLALIHPIPRVLWPNKPEGMSISVEDVVAAEGWTVATSVVGEEWIMHGFIAVALMSMFFGACCAWWNLLASPKNSEFGILVYASGFFSAVITMRSMNWFSTALLPTLAGLFLGCLFLLMNRKKRLERPVHARRPPAPAHR